MICDATAHINVGMVLQVIGGEILHVTAKSNGDKTITVTRSFGVTAAATTIADNVPLYVLGNANEENSSVPTILKVQNRSRTNYTQIFRDPFGLSGTLEATETYTGKKGP